MNAFTFFHLSLDVDKRFFGAFPKMTNIYDYLVNCNKTVYQCKIVHRKFKNYLILKYDAL